MARTSLVHYIAPTAISLTPNCNGSANDIAVYLARDTKIKVYSQKAGIDTVDANFQEWTLAGRNRRLADSSAPYTIYARLRKDDKTDGYLVFTKKQLDGGVWKDKYPYVTTEGLYTDTYAAESQDYWYIRLGDVTLPENSKREITLDTGILGTEQYNAQWIINPDDWPDRLDLTASIDGVDAGAVPNVYWGNTLLLAAHYIKGWDTVDDADVVRWNIARNTGNATADEAWNYPYPNESTRAREMTDGQIALHHKLIGDDFNNTGTVTFTVTAWGYDEDDTQHTQLVVLAEASMSVLAETARVEPANIVKVDRGQWTATPTATYDDEQEGTWTPDGTTRVDGDPTSYTQHTKYGTTGVPQTVHMGDTIAEPYHCRTFSKAHWLGRRLNDAWQQNTDAEVEQLMTLAWKTDLEVSRAWNYGALWECQVDGTTQEPRYGCTDWKLISNGNITLGFYSDEPDPVPVIGLSVRPGMIDETVVPYLLFGQEDISTSATSWSWERESNNAALDEAWKNSARVDPDDPTSPLKSQTRTLHITDDDMPDGWFAEGGRVGFKCTAVFGSGDDATEIINKITIV